MSPEQNPISNDLLDQLAQRFEWHAKNIYGVSSLNSSPLYAQLSLEIATDPAILSLVSQADLSQQVSNLLLGAVHFLLLSGVPSPLADYYPSLSPNPRPRHEAYKPFRSFCLEHADTIRHLVITKRVQTNEVHRCTALLPAFGTVAKRASNHPLALVEIARLLERVVDVVGGDRLGAASALGLQAERVAVEDPGLLGLELDAPGDDLGDRPGILGGGEQQLAELPDGDVVQLLLALEQRLGLVDHRRRPDQGRQRLVRSGPLGDVLRCDVGGGRPVGERRAGRHRAEQAGDRRQESVRLLLDRSALAPLGRSPWLRGTGSLGRVGRAGGGAGHAHREAGNQDGEVSNRRWHDTRPYLKRRGWATRVLWRS